MARDFGPFPSEPMYEVVNRRMQKALAEATVSTGFAKPGQGAVTAGTGAQLVIAAYPDGALVDGLYVENSEAETVTLTTNSGSTNPRIDRLVMRLDMAAETIEPFQIVGTPAASPQVPPLVRTSTVVDMPLCQYRFPGSASAQNPTSIVDERVQAAAGHLGDNASASTGTAGGTSATILSEAVTVPAGLPAGRRIKVTGTVFLSTGTGVGATINCGGTTRTFNVGTLASDFTVTHWDTDLTAGSRTFTLAVQSTVSGQNATWRSPQISVEIV